MKSYCLKCIKDKEKINPRVSNTGNARTIILSKCVICGSKPQGSLKIKKQRTIK